MLWQPSLPDRYTTLSPAELRQAVAARKAELGRDLIILGHHYQQDEVIQFADFTGDSFKLSQLAAERIRAAGAKYVVFAGVHFMAESADVLAPQGTIVILPDLSAGCSMADMADDQDVLEAWGEIHRVLDDRRGQAAKEPSGLVTGPQDGTAAGSYRVIPICYMNSTAAIKAFCGEHGGAACTSSNCRKVFEWALAGGSQPLRPGKPGEQIKILFIPDQHLGRNTAAAMGFDIHNDMCLWDPRSVEGLGGSTPEQLRQARFILWKGHCSVHKLFRAEHVDQIRAQWPDVKVIVHPECVHEVVLKADMVGSTEGIIKIIDAAAPGTRWAVGTEVHMVNRLAQSAANRGVTVRILSECQCLCTTMYRIDLPHLLWVLDNLAAGKVVNQVQVDLGVKRWALIALSRMLEISAGTSVSDARSPEARKATGHVADSALASVQD